MSAKARFKTQIPFQKLSSSKNLRYPYLPHKLGALTIAQKMLLSPEIPYQLQEDLQNMICIDIQAVVRKSFCYEKEDEDIFKMNLSPVYPACFLYTQAPDFIYNSKTGTKEKWGNQECAWGVQHYSLQIPPSSDGYSFARTLLPLPEKQPCWFEQVHWIHFAASFLEVPAGKYRRCVGPVLTASMLLDAAGSIVCNETGKPQMLNAITHDDIEDLLYWYSGIPLAPNFKPEARQELTMVMRDYFSLNLLLSLIAYTQLNDPETRLLPKEIVPFTAENEGTIQGGRTPRRPLTLNGQQLLMALPPFPIAEEDRVI